MRVGSCPHYLDTRPGAPRESHLASPFGRIPPAELEGWESFEQVPSQPPGRTTGSHESRHRGALQIYDSLQVRILSSHTNVYLDVCYRELRMHRSQIEHLRCPLLFLQILLTYEYGIRIPGLVDFPIWHLLQEREGPYRCSRGTRRALRAPNLLPFQSGPYSIRKDLYRFHSKNN